MKTQCVGSVVPLTMFFMKSVVADSETDGLSTTTTTTTTTSADAISPKNGQKSLAIVGGVAVLLLFVGCVALILIKRGRAGNVVVVKQDINEIYSDYHSDPNAVVEMIDYNEYYSKSYEAGSTATRDNNSQYYY